MTKSAPLDNRAERVLAYMVAATVGLSVLAIIASLIGQLAGLTRDGMTEGIWPAVIMLPLIGLPIGFVLLVALLITNGVRRARQARQGES
ncbi:hypothetical protein MN032_17960 [Agromyces atrinae]|uniref:Multidrug ABC transporter ATPase n=2 Tax=Agromyces atrinae TaxID=592376 RepID=A0A852SLX6_9MICO|nr:hypothetical protein [Agromyces atrinae]MCI2959573.1 hypothetical protein [Agromyces atrinae]NYD68637.1 hypothetical protein [Agromyces atrinae]